MKAWITALMVSLLFVLPANAKDYGSLTNQLQRKMREEDVIRIFGSPTSTSMEVCGPAGQQQFVCKRLVYWSNNIGQMAQIWEQSYKCADASCTQGYPTMDGSGDIWLVMGWYAS